MLVYYDITFTLKCRSPLLGLAASFFVRFVINSLRHPKKRSVTNEGLVSKSHVSPVIGNNFPYSVVRLEYLQVITKGKKDAASFHHVQIIVFR